MLTLLHDLKSQNLLSELNYQFAAMIARKQASYAYTPTQQNLAILLSAMVSYSVMQGHTALRLTDDLLHSFVQNIGGKHDRDIEAAILQKIGQVRPLAWQDALRGHIAFTEDPAQVAPILFQNGLAYFYRYWQAEQRIASYLLQAVENDENVANCVLDKKVLDRLFPASDSVSIDWQKVAVATALKKRFTLISGGPGTGKTYTVSAILLALQLKQLEQGLPLLNIALAAPTGKAAARMNESIRSGLNAFSAIPNTIKESLPESAQTIHRLIGMRPLNDMPLYHKENPLHLDVLVIDEASMIDVSLMEKLINALKPSTRLIMLGDKDQLASVEAGAIMGELRHFIGKGYSVAHSDYLNAVTNYAVECAPKAAEIQDSLCLLTHSRRFDAQSGIGHLAAKVNAMQAQASWDLLSKTEFSDLLLVRYPEMLADKQTWTQQCADLVIKEAVNCYAKYLALVKERMVEPSKDNIGAIFDAFEEVRFLTALRVSELGAERLNVRIAEALKKKGWLDFGHSREQYAGKPILITENDVINQIFSGDIGIVLPDEHGSLKAYFRIAKDNIRSISLNRLPKSELAYVMTVHKSQGSEFSHTLFVMPTQLSPVLTKELIYTAVTRAKEKLTIFGSRETWNKAVKSEVIRQSGLREQIESSI